MYQPLWVLHALPIVFVGAGCGFQGEGMQCIKKEKIYIPVYFGWKCYVLWTLSFVEILT